MAKKVDAKALKEKKQKRLAAILLVLMLGVMAFSVPKTLKMMNQQPAAATPPPATAPAPTDAAAGAAVPPADAGAAAVAATGTPTLVVSSTAGPTADGQLVSFERFASKDPFVQQISQQPAKAGVAPAADADAGATIPAGAVGAVGGKASGEAGSAGEPAASSPPTGATGAVPGSTPAAPAPAPASPAAVADPTAAQISVNGGAAENVAVEGTFPTAEPMFVVVELLPTGAKIAVADGKYENGAETITLTAGRPLTLMNTSDGTRYEILLVSVS